MGISDSSIKGAKFEDTGYSYTMSLTSVLDQLCTSGEEHMG